MNVVDAAGIIVLFLLCALVGFMAYQPPRKSRYLDLNAMEASNV